MDAQAHVPGSAPVDAEPAPRGRAAAAPGALLREARALAALPCTRCGSRFCAHAAILGIALGFKGTARCLPCTARAMDRAPDALYAGMETYLRQRDCFREAWEETSRAEGVGDPWRPRCVTAARESVVVPRAAPEPSPPPDFPRKDDWDAGEMSCGDLVLALRQRMEALAPGGTLRLIARDPAAPEDIPAWCRITGHALERAAHPEYRIRRRPDPRKET